MAGKKKKEEKDVEVKKVEKEVKQEPKEEKVVEKKPKVKKVEKEKVEEKTEKKEEQIVDETRKTIDVPENWKPKTELGKKVYSGEITDIGQVFAEGIKIAESEIVDVLLPDLQNEIILVGGTTGKGGGIRRTPFKRTSRMHRSGRRYKISVMSVVGNKNGYVGIGLASGPMGKNRQVITKAVNRAKLNIIPVLRGCGSWECLCGGHHSIPFAVDGKSGSVKIRLMSAPKGVGLVASDEIKKMLRLGGIGDIWCNTRGNTQTRINLLMAAFNGLKKLNTYILKSDFEEKVGMKSGRVE